MTVVYLSGVMFVSKTHVLLYMQDTMQLRFNL